MQQPFDPKVKSFLDSYEYLSEEDVTYVDFNEYETRFRKINSKNTLGLDDNLTNIDNEDEK